MDKKGIFQLQGDRPSYRPGLLWHMRRNTPSNYYDGMIGRIIVETQLTVTKRARLLILRASVAYCTIRHVNSIWPVLKRKQLVQPSLLLDFEIKN